MENELGITHVGGVPVEEIESLAESIIAGSVANIYDIERHPEESEANFIRRFKEARRSVS